MALPQEVRTLYNAEIAGSGVRVTVFPNDGAAPPAPAAAIAVPDAAAKVYGVTTEIAAKTKVGAAGTRYKIVGCAYGNVAVGALVDFQFLRFFGVIAGAQTRVFDMAFFAETEAGGYAPIWFPGEYCAACLVDGVASDIAAAYANIVGGGGAVNIDVLAYAATGMGT